MLLFMGMVSSEVSFFEGDYDEDYIVFGKNNFDDDEIFCGNAVCDLGEDCLNCQRDCGFCVEEDFGGSTGFSFQDYFEKRICELALEYNLNMKNENDRAIFFEKLNKGRLLKISRDKFNYYIENFREKCGDEYFFVGDVAVDFENMTSKNNPRLIRISGNVIDNLQRNKSIYVGAGVVLIGVISYFFIKRRYGN